MNVTDSIPRAASSLAVCWRGASWQAVSGPERHEVVVTLVGGGRHRQIEAWIMREGRRRTLVERRAVRCEAWRDERFLHVDAYDGRVRLLAVSLAVESARLVYASTPLLTRTGLPAGAFDPPVAERRDSVRDAASA